MSDETRLRAIVREEIGRAFKALNAAANDLDMPYETSELDSRALRNIAEAADRAAHEFKELCETADEQQAQDPKNPFAEPGEQPHIHRFEYADDGVGHSGSFCDCDAEELAVENERRRIAHAAAYLPAVDLNALDASAYKLLGNIARNDAYTNAVIRLVQHGGPRIGR